MCPADEYLRGVSWQGEQQMWLQMQHGTTGLWPGDERDSLKGFAQLGTFVNTIQTRQHLYSCSHGFSAASLVLSVTYTFVAILYSITLD